MKSSLSTSIETTIKYTYCAQLQKCSFGVRGIAAYTTSTQKFYYVLLCANFQFFNPWKILTSSTFTPLEVFITFYPFFAGENSHKFYAWPDCFHLTVTTSKGNRKQWKSMSWLVGFCASFANKIIYTILGNSNWSPIGNIPLTHSFPVHPFSIPLKTSDTVFWCFQGVKNRWIGNKWVKTVAQKG